MELLRFLTAGSVDDGKSTLIGRLLYDSKHILADQLEMLQKQSKNKGHYEVDLALLTDGLRAEREQGITIDVAYKYFSTKKRKYIIADAPGHVQYTRNMVTAASTAEAIVLLVDARAGVIEQTKRHAYIAAMMNIRHVIFAINKMDLLDYDMARFIAIKNQCISLCKQLELHDSYIIPIVALHGDNITETSLNMPWYSGPSVLEVLESLPVRSRNQNSGVHYQVQYVNRPQSDELHDFRGYMGILNSGGLKQGDAVKVFPSGFETRIKQIWSAGKVHQVVEERGVYTLELEDDVDISRGDVIRNIEDQTEGTNEFKARICWFSNKKGKAGMKVLLQQHSTLTRAVVSCIEYKIDINSYDKQTDIDEISLNDIVSVVIKTQKPLLLHSGETFQSRMILIDEINHNTLAAVIADRN